MKLSFNRKRWNEFIDSFPKLPVGRQPLWAWLIDRAMLAVLIATWVALFPLMYFGCIEVE